MGRSSHHHQHRRTHSILSRRTRGLALRYALSLALAVLGGLTFYVGYQQGFIAYAAWRQPGAPRHAIPYQQANLAYVDGVIQMLHSNDGLATSNNLMADQPITVTYTPATATTTPRATMTPTPIPYQPPPLVIGQKAARTLFVPVLMYHYIRVDANPADLAGWHLSIPPSIFDAQMAYVVARGYHTITPDQFGNALLYGASLPNKPIMITFDDGYEDCYTTAYPILQKYHLQAVSFLVTGFINQPNYLTWQQIKTMGSSGLFTFEAHTVDHIDLAKADATRVAQEVVLSKQILQAHLGYPINWMAYPSGQVNPAVIQQVTQAGYLGAFGTSYGEYATADARFTLPRVRVDAAYTMREFEMEIP